VHDYIFEDMDVANLYKCHAAANSIGNEVAFYFPSRKHPWYVGPAGGPGSDTDPPPSIPADVNLLTLPNSFDAWAQNAASAQISGFGPDGATPATRLGASVDAGEHYIEHPDTSVQSQETYTYSVYAHTTTDWNLGLRMTTGNQATVFALFNLSTHTLVNSGGPVGTPLPPPFEKFYPSFISAGVETDALATGAAGNGWYRFTLTFKSDVGPAARVSVSVISGTDWSFTGDGLVKFITVWGAALNTGDTAVDPEVEQLNPIGTMLSNEPNRYVKLNPVEQGRPWDSGILGRTAWINNNVFGMPLGADLNFRIQQHERGFDDDDQPMRGVYAEMGYSRIGDGTQMASIHQCQPDFKWFGQNGAVNLTLKTASYAQAQPVIYGPYSMTPTTRFFNPRARGHYVAVRYDWAERRGFSARAGAVMMKTKPTGRMP
jgi:hypothetical protein